MKPATQVDGDGPRQFAAVGLYCAALIGTVVLFGVIRGYGETLHARAPGQGTSFVSSGAEAGHSQSAARRPDVLPHVLLTLAAVVFIGAGASRLFRLIHQPPVMGEVCAGILLGPSLWGERFATAILPADAAPFLAIIAQLGVILYMFLVGLEVNLEFLRQRARVTVAIAHASILAPFVLGCGLALLLYPRFSDSSVPFTSFSLFLGVAMSVTAFPVLARILTDTGLSQTSIGKLALGCAAAGDITAWCLLAFVTGIARSRLGEGLTVALGALAYVAVILIVVRPLAGRAAARAENAPLGRGTAAIVFAALLLSSLATEWIGIHAIFGAFLLGAIIPHDSVIARDFREQLSHIVTVLLLPAFFALTGMRTRIDLVSGYAPWLYCLLIIVVATVGKWGGTFIAALLSGMSWRIAAALGALMNTRGLMELIVLNVGLELRVISPALFSMLVLMALVTTMTAVPALRLFTARINS